MQPEWESDKTIESAIEWGNLFRSTKWLVSYLSEQSTGSSTALLFGRT